MLHRLSPLLVFAGVLMLAGCRTYGDQGYDSGPKTYTAIQQTVQQTEQSLSRAESDLRRLQSAAESADTLQPLVDRYQSLVASHGAMVTDQRLLRSQYERTTRKVWATVRDSTLSRTPKRRESDYSITPVQYPRSERPEISMAEALRGLEGTPGLQQDEQAAGGE